MRPSPAGRRGSLTVTVQANRHVVYSTQLVRLLEAIAATGSINAAASRLNLHYRRAWGLVHALETHLATPLLETHTGGSHGGGSGLTPAARRYLKHAQRLHHQLERLLVAHGLSAPPASK